MPVAARSASAIIYRCKRQPESGARIGSRREGPVGMTITYNYM